MKKWSKYFIISIVAVIICLILCGIFNTSNDTVVLWEVFRVALVITIISSIITMIGCIVMAIKNKEKMPIWLILIIVIILVIGALWIVGAISQKDYEDNKAVQKQQEIQDYLKNPNKYNYEF